MMETQTIREKEIDCVRGLAIILVVLGHVFQANLLPGQNSAIWDIIKAIQMPLLFVVSGYSMAFTFPTKKKAYIKKKIKRLLCPYLFWATVHYLIVCLLPLEDYKCFGVKAWILEYWISDFWFLRQLFLYFLIIWICTCVFTELIKHLHIVQCYNTFIVLATSFLIVLILSKYINSPETINRTYYLMFIIGFIINKVRYSIIKDKKMYNILIELLCMITIFVIIICINNKMISVWLGGLALAISVFGAGLIGFGFLKNSKTTKLLSEIGKNTLAIYAIHWCLLFSPLWRMNVYSYAIYLKIPFFFRNMLVFIIWMNICWLFIKILKKNAFVRGLCLGEW